MHANKYQRDVSLSIYECVSGRLDLFMTGWAENKPNGFLELVLICNKQNGDTFIQQIYHKEIVEAFSTLRQVSSGC